METKYKLESLNINELSQIKNEVENELSKYLDSYNGFCMLKTKMNDSKIIISNINANTKNGDEIIVPLSTSLFVPGTIEDNDKFLVDLGTNYFAEVSSKKAIEYCSHTEGIINNNITKIKSVIDEKRKYCDDVNILIQKKYQEYLKNNKK